MCVFTKLRSMQPALHIVYRGASRKLSMLYSFGYDYFLGRGLSEQRTPLLRTRSEG